MPLFGNIVVIKRNGTDGISFPLTASSCLFGRRTECDIRIQLPQVSKEHCKIEVNENKEAVLTNLSTVNPTKLNGGCVQHPVPLKHGDVLTIIDRSFRFEYPLQSTPRKRRSRSPKDETLQVLHVQQVAEVELLQKQPPGAKSLHASDTAEGEEKAANENKQSTEKSVSKALPFQLRTPKSSYRMRQSVKKEVELSPFSKLYEKLKHEIEAKKPLQLENRSQQATKEGGKNILLCPSARFSASSSVYDLGNLITKEKETDRGENTEECKIELKQEVITLEFNQISVVGSATKKSFTRSPRPSFPVEMWRDTDKRSHLQDQKELSTADKYKGMEVTIKSSKENDGSAAFPQETRPTVLLHCVSGSHSPLNAVDKSTQTTKVSEVDVLSTPTSRRKSLRSHFGAPTEETGGMNPGNTDTPTSRRRASLKRKSLSEALAETPRDGSENRNDGLEPLPRAENQALKERRNSKQATPGKPVKEAALKEICERANFVNSKEEEPESPAASNSKGPKRSNRQSKELPNKNVQSERLASEEFTSEVASPAGQKSGSGKKRGRLRTSGLLAEKASEANAAQEHPEKIAGGKESGAKEELPTKGCHRKQGLEDAGVTRPRRLSAERKSSGNAAAAKDSEASVSEMNISGPLAGEESGKKKRILPKRKSDDLLLQPLGKRKRVSFGGHLSPELFDKSLPPNSPLKRGATPARLSLPFGNSPRAVLKKAQGLKHFAVQELSEHLQNEKMSPKHLQAQKSPVTSSPASPKATPTKYTSGSPAPYRKGRFSVSRIATSFPIAEEKDPVAEDLNPKEESGARVKTPKSSPINRDEKTCVTAKSAQLPLKGTPMKRRSGVVASLKAKRRSGASSANLLVAKSWAEVVKLGVARPQSKPVKKSVRKGRPLKKTTKSPKTPERKIKGHFSTGHAESPATLVVGRAYSTTVKPAGQVPKVVKNPLLKLNMNMDESFTGMPEMFQTPENKSGKSLSLGTVPKTDFTPTLTAEEISELHTPEETGEMMVSPLNSSDASEQKHDSPGICCILREKESLNSMFDAVASNTPEKRKSMLEENSVDTLSIIPEKQASRVKSGSKRRTPKQKLEPPEVASGIKQLFRTPKQRSEPVEALSGIRRLMKTPKQKLEPVEALLGIKRLMKTPKQKLEPVEALSGIKWLMKTPKQKPEPVEALSGIKQLMKTPKQKPEPVEALSGIRRLMKTPKQKPEPVEALSGIKRLMKTPKQKPEPVEALSGIRRLMKTPKQKLEPVEALSGIKHLMKTPKQKPEPVEALSGIKRLMKTPKKKPEPIEVLSGIKQLLRTPKEKSEPVEVMSGIKQLMRTPQQKPEPVEVLSGIKQLMRTPEQELEPVTDEVALKSLLETPVQKREAVKDVAGVNSIKKTPKLKNEPVEDMIGISRIFKTPKEKVEPIENMFGISRLVKTPREKHQPVEDFVGLQRLMAEPRQKHSDLEVDYVGVTEMFDTPEKIKVRSADVTDSKQEDPAPLRTNPSQKYEVKGNISQGEDPQQEESTSEDQSPQRPTRGRPRKTVLPASAKQREKDLNSEELHDLEKKSTQEEVGEISTSASVAKNEGRGKRRNRSVQEETVSKQPHQEKVETVSFVEPHGATQRPGRGKRREAKELKRPGENPESCDEDSSVPQEELASMRQTLQECGIDDIIETEDEPTMKTGSVSSNIPNENHQLQTGLEKPEKKSAGGDVEDSEEMLLSPGRRTRGVKRVENTEPLTPPKRGRRARNDQVKRPSSEDLRGPTRKLRKDPSAKVMKRDEQTFDKDAETATAEESEKGTKCEIKIPEKRVKSLRSAGRRSAEGTAEICGVALENAQNIPKTEETSSETQSHLEGEMKVPQGDGTENAQEKTTEASQRLKAESPSGETNKMPVTALNLEAKRTRNRRGKKDSLETKTDELAKGGNDLELIAPQIKSETDETSLTGSLGSVCVKDTDRVPKDESGPAANSDSLARGRQKRTRNGQGTVKAKQTETLPENQAQKHETAAGRGRGRKVKFGLEEASSKAAEGKRSLLEDDKEIASKAGQPETSENPLQVRRSRRKQVDSVPQVACPTSAEKQPLIVDQRKDEAFVKEQDSALEATPPSTEDSPPRRGRRREVAAAAQTSRSLSVRTRRGLLEADDKTTTVREDQNSALGNQTLQAKANASARDKGKEIDPTTEEKSSSSLRRKCGSSETGDREEGTNEEQNKPLEAASSAKEKPLGRSRRKEAALESLPTHYISLRGKRGLPANNGGEAAPKEDQSVPSESSDSAVKANQLRKGRGKEIALLLETTSSTQGKRSLSKERSRRNNCREGKKLILENSTSQERMNLPKGRSNQTVALQAVSSPSLQDLPEDGKNETCEEQQSALLEAAPPAKENPSRAGRKKTISSKSEEANPTSLREKPALPKGRSQKRILKETEDISLENNSSQENTRQLRNKRTRVEFASEAAISTSLPKTGDMPENGNALKTHNVSLMSTGSEKTNQSGEGKEGTPVQQATATSRRRKCQLPADDLASKKLKSESDENASLRRGRRNNLKEKLREEDVKAAGGTDRKTRSSTRTRK